SVGNTEYFVTGRGNWNDLGLENPTGTLNAIHDQTQQGKFFGYASTLLDESTRCSWITAASYSQFQIPSNPGQTPLGDFPFGAPVTSFDSSTLNEKEYDTYVANIATLQKHGTDGDAQLAFYSRYAEVHFVPDIFGDMVFNDRHTSRGGFAVSAEQTTVSDVSTVMPGDVGAVTGPAFPITDKTSLLG